MNISPPGKYFKPTIGVITKGFVENAYVVLCSK